MRIVALVAIPLAVVVLALVVLGSGGKYTVKARFLNAGQLVQGGLVEVGGRKIGVIKKLELADNGEAEATMEIRDDEYDPLHRGTKAKIRSVGLATVTNRFIELDPGPDGAKEIEDGGVIGIDDTKGIVDLDAVLDEFDPPTRKLLQKLIRNGSKIYAGSEATIKAANLGFRYLNPALSQVAALSRELVRDQTALDRLLTTAADVSGALASRQADIEQGIGNTATALRAIASERASLEDAVARSPGVLRQAQGTLVRARGTLQVIRPALRDLTRASPSIARLLRTLEPTVRRAVPVLRDTRAILPSVRRALRPLPALARFGVPTLRSTSSALNGLVPILAGFRAYSADLANGLFNAFLGASGSYYDANGRYARINLVTNVTKQTGLLDLLLGGIALPAIGSPREGLLSRCPGAAVEAAPDGSNPFDPKDSPFLADPICNRGEDH